ncbi:hypothetical protein CRG98_028545 [Punica granatum]|uniref:Uncharacterized protein n=1 Tax=Punica granatum TaxID=22663 RepID=A0A2I0J495_PUNGR|nr:hypothetical protein CRG98_028545 [Punica granatum]
MTKWVKHGNWPVSRWKKTSRTQVVQGSSWPHSSKEGHELPWPTRVGKISSAPIRILPHHAIVLPTIKDKKKNIGTDPFREGGNRPSLGWGKGTYGSLPRDLAVSPMAQSVAKGASPVRIRVVSRHGTQERNRRKRELCTVGRPSDRDHLVTREGEGCEEPFERDGTTRRSRGENRHVVEVRCAPGRFCPVRTIGAEFSVPRSPIALCASRHSFRWPLCPVGDRWVVVPDRRPLARWGLGTCDRDFSQCSLNVLRCSGIAAVSVFRECAPKICREVFATTETSFGEPRRVPNGRLELVPWPRWSLGACRPVLGGRLLVSGAGPESSVRKGVRERSRCPGLCGYRVTNRSLGRTHASRLEPPQIGPRLES